MKLITHTNRHFLLTEIVSEMTYTVLSGTLNSTIPYHTMLTEIYNNVHWSAIDLHIQTGKIEIEQDNPAYNHCALIMVTPFICVLTEFKQGERRSHTFPLEMTSSSLHHHRHHGNLIRHQLTMLTGANNAKKLRLKTDTKTYTVNTAT